MVAVRDLFPGYYRPTQEQFQRFWVEGIFALDTNILLNVYRYSEQANSRLFEVLERLKGRLWIPYQAMLEYQRNRLKVISQQVKAFDEIEKGFDDAVAKVRALEQQFRKHPSIDSTRLTAPFDGATAEAKKQLEDFRNAHRGLSGADELRERLDSLLEGAVGPQQKNIAELQKKAKERIELKVPPGYLDASKAEPDRYGDVLIWFALLEQAKAKDKPLVFVTDDKKDDWWWREDGMTIGPRPELVAEFQESAGVSFYMYDADQFLNMAASHFELASSPEVAAEVRAISEQGQLYPRDVSYTAWVFVEPGGILPTGSILYAPSQPAGALPADGQVVSRSHFADLFSLIGTSYGPGDGSTTFNLPNAARDDMGAWRPAGNPPHSH